MKPNKEPTHIRTTITLFGDGWSQQYQGDKIALPPACDEEELQLAAQFSTGNTWAKLPEPVKLRRV